MGVYEWASQNETCVKVVRGAKKKLKMNKMKKRLKGDYKFIDRKKDNDKMCIILAGYKQFLWEDVFGRIKKYVPLDIDVCIVSSGLYSEELEEISKENDWSYLSVKRNKVTLVQNIAINLFPSAELIFKLDEDMFVTENFFKELLKTYEEVESNSFYKVGFVAPLIPINDYAYSRVIERLGLVKNFEKKFGKLKCDWAPVSEVITNPEIATYLWGKSEKKLRDLDVLAKEFGSDEFKYSICPIRFSIGAILFSRKLWKDMGYFEVAMGTNMGRDETQICNYVFNDSRVIAVSENTIVGHFSYGKQTEKMREYYDKHREIFKVK